MFEILRIFYYALVNNDKHNEYSYYVMKLPYVLLYEINYYTYDVILLYKN